MSDWTQEDAQRWINGSLSRAETSAKRQRFKISEGDGDAAWLADLEGEASAFRLLANSQCLVSPHALLIETDSLTANAAQTAKSERWKDHPDQFRNGLERGLNQVRDYAKRYL